MVSAKSPKLQQAGRTGRWGRWGRWTTQTEGGCCPWRGIHAGEGFLSGAVTCGVTKQEWSDPESLSDPEREKDPHWSNSWKLQVLGKVYIGEVWERLYPLGDTLEQRNSLRGRAWQRHKCCDLTPIPIPHPPWAVWGREGRRLRSEEPRNMWRSGQKCFFSLALTSHYPTLLLIGKKIKWIFPRMKLVYTSAVTALYLTHEDFHLIFSPCSAKERECWNTLLDTWRTAKFQPPQWTKFE